MLNRKGPWRRGLSTYHRASLMVMKAHHCYELQAFSMLSNYDYMKAVKPNKLHYEKPWDYSG